MTFFKNISYLLVFIPLLITQSCVKDVELDYSSYESKLVLNAMVSTQQNWSVDISKSGNVLSNTDNIEKISDAHVIVRDLTSNRVIRLLATHKRGIYVNENSKPIEGHTYEIKVSHPDYTTIYATTQMPKTIDVKEIGRKRVLDENGNETIQIDLDVNQQNLDLTYFLDWSLITTDTSKLITIETNYEIVRITKNDSPDNRNKVKSGFRYIIDKNNIDDPNISLVVSSGNENEGGNGSNKDQTDNGLIMELTVTTISDDYYKYFKSLSIYRSQSGEEKKKSNSSKTLYTNVENGYGIFGSYNVKKHKF